MTAPLDTAEALRSLKPTSGLVVLMCGLAGSGKTTFSKQLELKGFKRLSIDEEVWKTFGRFGVDYDASEYPRCLEATRKVMTRSLIEAMGSKRPTVVDSAFWNRASRDEHKALIEEYGCAWKVVYLKADPEVLRRRLAQRSDRFDANAAFPVTDDLLDRFLSSFEEPADEGEMVVSA